MAELVSRLRVFISSPGDLQNERQIAVDTCRQVTQDMGAIHSFFLDPLVWETHTFSAVGEYPQAVVNEQIGTEYDIFLGIMASKFGTPTPKWGSGTEEEFRNAYGSFKKNGLPEIAFFFSEAPIRPSSLDVDQLKRVLDFKNDIGKLGVLYASVLNLTLATCFL